MSTDVATVRLVPYAPHHASAFRALNVEWITRHFEMEPDDEAILADPSGEVLDKGGDILIAERSGIVVGTCALLPHTEETVELIKMAVDPAARGLGIGRMLGEAAIARARALGFRQIELVTHSSLAPALRLYRALGFVEIPVGDMPYKRADVRMIRDT